MRDRDLRIRPGPFGRRLDVRRGVRQREPGRGSGNRPRHRGLSHRSERAGVDAGRQGWRKYGTTRPRIASLAAGQSNRLKAISSGLGTGLVIGLLCGAVFSVIRRKERWSFLRIGAFAAAGMALGLSVAFLIPDEYVSTAVAQSVDRDTALSPALQVLSEDSLAAIIRQEGLFPAELARGGMSQATRKMRESIRVQLYRLDRPPPSPSASVTPIVGRHSR